MTPEAEAAWHWRHYNVCTANGFLTRAKRHEILARYYEKQAEKHDSAGG